MDEAADNVNRMKIPYNIGVWSIVDKLIKIFQLVNKRQYRQLSEMDLIIDSKLKNDGRYYYMKDIDKGRLFIAMWKFPVILKIDEYSKYLVKLYLIMYEINSPIIPAVSERELAQLLDYEGDKYVATVYNIALRSIVKCEIDNGYWKKIMRDILRQLKVIHGNNLVHADIKPDNILEYANYDFSLCDFEFCKRPGVIKEPHKNEASARYYMLIGLFHNKNYDASFRGDLNCLLLTIIGLLTDNYKGYKEVMYSEKLENLCEFRDLYIKVSLGEIGSTLLNNYYNIIKNIKWDENIYYKDIY